MKKSKYHKRLKQNISTVRYCTDMILYVMLVFSDTTEADTIRYDTPSIGCDTIPIRLASVLYSAHD